MAKEDSARGFASKAARNAKALATRMGTQGIWMLGSPFYHEERDVHILFLDFEGFKSSARGASSAASQIDSKLFALSTLISSTICFNIVKTLDEKTLEELELIKGLEKRIKIRPPERAANFMHERGTPGGRSTIEDQQYAEHLIP